MIHRHRRTGGLYRLLFESFSVERQAKSVIYMSIETGQIFDRDARAFAENFDYVLDAQGAIVPKGSR